MMNRLYIYDVKFLPYGSQLIPLSVILSVLGDDASSAGARQKIHEWLWCGIFGELYGGTTETRFARDVPEVVAWVRGTVPPRTPRHSPHPRVSRLQRSLRIANAAGRQGLDHRRCHVRHHLLRRADRHPPHLPPGLVRKAEHPTATVQLDYQQDTHHRAHQPDHQVVRKAETTVDVVRSSIESHLVDVDLLTADDFDAFYETRRSALLQLVIEAMGKPVEDIRNQDKFAVESEDES